MDTYFLEFHIKHEYANEKKTELANVVKTAIQAVFPECNLAYSSTENDVIMLFIDSSGTKLLTQLCKNSVLAINIDHHFVESATFPSKVKELYKHIQESPCYVNLNAVVEDVLPPIKRGRDLCLYDNISSGMLIERDYEEKVFDKVSPYQHVKIMRSTQYGGILFLDEDCNLAESDLEYTKAITGYDNEDYRDKTVLILGGGDGGILHHLRDRGPKMITMIDIDQMVIDAAKIHLRGICFDALDSMVGPNYEVIVDDCVVHLEKYVSEGKKFDFVINDLTAIPVSTTPVGDHWDFMRKILKLSMMVLADNGRYYTQGNSQLQPNALAMYEQQLGKLGCPVKFEKKIVCVPSYLENWIFYKIWKDLREQA